MLLRGGRAAAAAVLPAARPETVVAWLHAALDGDVARVAVDAPATLSAGAHADDATLAPKFRAARCGEIGLGRFAGVWVPWVSPAAPPVPGWMAAGMALFRALEAAGHDVVETYPHAVFRVLAGGAPLPAKSKPEGVAARAALLAGAGVDEATLPLWSHDGLDAGAAALVAADVGARAYTCRHDGSAIWLTAERAPVTSAT